MNKFKKSAVHVCLLVGISLISAQSTPACAGKLKDQETTQQDTKRKTVKPKLSQTLIENGFTHMQIGATTITGGELLHHVGEKDSQMSSFNKPIGTGMGRVGSVVTAGGFFEVIVGGICKIFGK